MIGSSTLIVKDGGKYRVHIIGGVILGDVVVKKFVTIDEQNTPEADNLSDGDVYTILVSHQCISENQPNYSKFAGDRKWLLDLSAKSFLSVVEFIKNWEAGHGEEIALEQQKQRQTTAEKTQRLLKEAKATAKVFARELLLYLEGKSKIPLKTDNKCMPETEFRLNGFSFTSWSSDPTSVQFFAPGWSKDRDLISKHFDFNTSFFPAFLKRNGWKVTFIKASDWQHNPMVSAFLAQKGRKTIYWNRHMESNISLVNLETV